MKFNYSIDVNRPQKEVAELFADPKYLKHYQEGFLRKELVSGSAGQDGAISKMYYRMGKGEMELTETIITNRLPDNFEAHYHHKNMDNTMKCRFIALSDNHTRYETEVEYTEFRGVIPKIMARFFPGIFIRQGQKWLNNFKEFVEKQGNEDER